MVLDFLKKAFIKRKKRIAEGVDVNEVMMLREAEPRKILQTIIEKKVPAIMTYLSRGKWHVAKVVLTDLGANMLSIEVSPRKKPRPINIQLEQPVGLSIKYGYGKFIFETVVVGLEPLLNTDSQSLTTLKSEIPTTSGGTIVLSLPDRIELVQRRSYFRVNVPSSLKVNVMLWHHCYTDDNDGNERSNTDKNRIREPKMPPDRYWEGRLVDISAGGGQIVVDAAQKPDFKKGQFIGLRFTPMPYEVPLLFNGQIRNILPTADNKSICLGLQLVGLEASPEGRSVLQRLCNVVERYHRMNQSGIKQHDMQPISS